LAVAEGVHHLLVTDRTQLIGVVCCCDISDVPLATPIVELLKSKFVCISSSATTADAAALMLEHEVGCLPVLDAHGALAGIITRADLRRFGALAGEPGVDRCATCSETHSLARVPKDGGRAFCVACRERARPHYFDEEEPSTLGGFG
jgi:signal-transduction protein with cAMP-binding, CBS, and nucleotidyltransferase domain